MQMSWHALSFDITQLSESLPLSHCVCVHPESVLSSTGSFKGQPDTPTHSRPRVPGLIVKWLLSSCVPQHFIASPTQTFLAMCVGVSFVVTRRVATRLVACHRPLHHLLLILCYKCKILMLCSFCLGIVFIIVSTYTFYLCASQQLDPCGKGP